ncbi:MAG: RpiB/LacA/LacB family sugar-phosphate isomerase, partial [Actinomycetota bacterium]
CDVTQAEMSRRHNDANVLCLGERSMDNRLIFDMVDVWLSTEFEGGRHARRLELIAELEGK